MLISGVWHQCDDGIIRPVIHAEILTSDGLWIKAPFLVDIGADRTVFSADIIQALDFQPLIAEEQLGGVGGMVAAVSIETQIRLTRENNGKVLLRGQYAGVLQAEALDMSVLGRDLTNLFAVLVDWPRQVVYLLGQRHQYSITQQ